MQSLKCKSVWTSNTGHAINVEELFLLEFHEE